MYAYLQKLIEERDGLSRTANGILDKAAEENRSVTDTEKATLTSMQDRCAAIDAEVETFSKDYESQKRWANLSGNLRNTEEPKREVAKRQPPNVETRDAQPWGAAFAESEALRTWHGHGKSDVVELGPAYETRAPIMTDFPPEGVLSPMRWTGNATQTWQPRLLALVNTVNTTAGAVDWVYYQPHPPAEAAIVPEGELKPEMPIELLLKSAVLQTIAHHVVLSRQALDDIPGIRQEVETRLRTGVLVRLQNMVAQALANETDFPTASAGTLLEAIRVAIGEMDDANGFAANGVLLNPQDWAQIDMAILAATMAGANVNTGAWGLRFVASNAVPPGTAYVGDFNSAVTLFQRSTTSVFASDSHADLFLRNMIAIIGEARAFAAVSQPLALLRVTSTSGAAAPGNGNGGG